MDKKYVDFDTIQSKIESLLFYENDCGKDFNLGQEKTIFDVLDILADMPAADVQEVRHGHWEECMSTLSSVKCSECGNSHEYDTAYCPSCGARMDGDEGGNP